MYNYFIMLCPSH